MAHRCGCGLHLRFFLFRQEDSYANITYPDHADSPHVTDTHVGATIDATIAICHTIHHPRCCATPAPPPRRQRLPHHRQPICRRPLPSRPPPRRPRRPDLQLGHVWTNRFARTLTRTRALKASSRASALCSAAYVLMKPPLHHPQPIHQHPLLSRSPSRSPRLVPGRVSTNRYARTLTQACAPPWSSRASAQRSAASVLMKPPLHHPRPIHQHLLLSPRSPPARPRALPRRRSQPRTRARETVGLPTAVGALAGRTGGVHRAMRIGFEPTADACNRSPVKVVGSRLES